jgi:hypothetical protein
MLAVANVRGALVSEHFWIDRYRLRDVTKASQRENAVPLPSAARRLLNLLLTEGGMVHEQDRSIKEDKKCGEPAGGP